MEQRTRRGLLGALAALVTLLGGGAAGAKSAPLPPHLSVIELFTSQGCSSCPPANDNVRALSERPDILALSFGVTYWDQLGWKDTFAQPAFTARQIAYARALHHDGPFTPQVVVDGRTDVVGARNGEIEALAARTHIAGGPSIAVRDGAVILSAAPFSGPSADVWLVRYDPRVIQVPIGAGENDGRTLPHKNVVRALIRLGAWSGGRARFSLPRDHDGLAAAVLVQTAEAGPILAVSKL